MKIVQKFLEVGHTQMECDSVHSCIERKIKGNEIHFHSDYFRILKVVIDCAKPLNIFGISRA